MRKKIQIIFIAMLCFGWLSIVNASETGFHPAIGEIRLNLPGAESAVVTPDGGLALWASNSGLVAGFPVFEDNKVFVSSPILADVNADGIKEIVVLTRDADDVFGASVYNGYGTLLASASLGTDTAYYDPATLATASGAKDGFVVGTNEGDALLFTYSGGQLAYKKLASFGVPISVSASASGDKIFITSPLNEEIAVLAKNDAVWEQTQTIQVGQPIIYPVTPDGQNNIFAVTADSGLTAINLDSGEKLANFPIVLPSAPVSSPVLADITADNAGDEVSVLMNNGDRNVFDKAGGEIQSGLPKKSFVEPSLDTVEFSGGLMSSVNNFGTQIMSKTKHVLGSVFSRIKMVFTGDNGSSLIVGLSFNEDVGATTFADTSGNANSGACAGDSCPVAGVTGKIGKSASFDGLNDKVELQDFLFFSPKEAVSLEAWIKPHLKSPDDKNMMVIATKDISYQLAVINPSSGMLGAMVRNANGEKQWAVAGNTHMPMDHWNHVAMTYDGSFVRLYLNGKEIASTPQTGTIYQSAHQMLVGSYYSNQYQFAGSIDEFKLYNSALAAGDIQKHFDDTPVNLVTMPVYLSLDEQVGATAFTDASNNDNNGSCSGDVCPTSGTSGKVGSAVNFDGVDDNISVSNLPNYAPIDAISMEAWIKPHLKSPDDKNMMVIATKDISYQLAVINPSSGLLGAMVRNDKGEKQWAVAGNTQMTMDHWNHVALTYDGANVKLFLNGKEVASTPQAGAIYQSVHPMLVGSYYSNQYQFAGVIDEFKLYNIALTSEEVQKHFDDTQGAAVTMPVYLPLDEEVGATTFADASNNDNNGACVAESCPIAGVVGKINSSASFDGADDFISIPQLPNYAPKNAMSVEAWIKPHLKDVEDTNMRVIASRGIDFELAILNPTFGSLGALVTNANGEKQWVTVGSGVIMDQWNHVAMTYDGTNVKLYINGKEVGSTPQSGDIQLTPVSVWLGHYNGLYRYLGEIDDFKLYNIALTPEEIQQHFDGV